MKGLEKYVKDACKTRLFALVHIAAHGLASSGCAGDGKSVFFTVITLRKVSENRRVNN